MSAPDPQSIPFLSSPDKHHFIGGRWTPSKSDARIEVRNPANGQKFATIARGNAADVDAAVAAARAAFEGPWSRFTPHERQALMLKIHDVLEKNLDEVGRLEAMDMGSPVSRAKQRKDWVLRCIRFFSTQTAGWGGRTIPNSLPGNFTTFTIKAPVGVIGGIIPWNGPMTSQWWTIAPALATGCTVVLKPPEDASLSMLRTAELLAEAGLPEGVLNVVTGVGPEAGAALAAHPDVDRISFTGSTRTGREIIKASAVNMKRVSVELGGKSPDIVFADADMQKAVQGAAMGVFNNSGQICYAGTRLFVQRSIYEEFAERLVAFTKTLKVGDPFDATTQLGPLISQRQMDQVLGYIEIGSKEGARLASGGDRLGGGLAEGYYVQPAVFTDVSNSMRIAREEIFGPVASVIPFDTEEDALRLANDTEYGLGGGVWSKNMSTILKMVHGIKTGTVWVNCYGQIDMAVGFGGVKQSGYGWKGGSEHVDAFLYEKVACINGD